MNKSELTEEQITYALRQAESGTPVAEICRKMEGDRAELLPLEAKIRWYCVGGHL